MNMNAWIKTAGRMLTNGDGKENKTAICGAPETLAARSRTLPAILFAGMLILCQMLNAAQAQTADLAVQKTGPDSAAPGANVSYDITVTNFGPDAATSVSLNDPLPAGMTFVSLVQNNGPAFVCALPTVGSGGTITCTIATLASGAIANFTLIANIPGGTPGGTFFTNIATLADLPEDPNTENNSSVATTSTPSTAADLGVTKNGPGLARPNSDVAYTITVTNAGPASAQTITLSDTLPGTMTFVSLTQNSGPAFSCNTPAGGAGGTVTCTLASMANGASATFTLTGNVPAGTAAGTTYTNSASVSSAQDPTSENDVATTSTDIASSDLSTLVSGPASVNAGAPLSYSVTITNNGPDITIGTADVTITLPSGATGASALGSGWVCNAPAGGVISCSSGANIANGASFPVITVSMTAPAAPGNVQNSATVSSLTDANPGNNVGSATTNVVAQADLSITKTGPASTSSGQNVVYTIVVTNHGPSTATGVTVSDPTPAQMSFVSNSGACVSTFPCNLGSIAAGQSATITATFSTPVGFSGNASNTATVSSSVNDPNGGNNSATATTNFAAPADLSITKTAAPGPYLTRAALTYTITVSNTGPATATGVVVNDVIPAGTNFISATPSQGSCAGTSTVSCNLGTLANGASATISLQLGLPSTAGTVQNTATVTGSVPDSVPANNSATATITVDAPTPFAIPTLSQLSLVLVSLLLAFGGMWRQRRRKR